MVGSPILLLLMPELLMIDDIPVEVRFNAKRRTRIAVDIDPAGHVVLDAPVRTQHTEVEELVRQHARWLRFRVNRIREETAHLGRAGFKPGELVLYLGDALRLEHGDGARVTLDKGVLRVPAGDESDTRRLIRNWYSERADHIFAEVIGGYVHLPWLNGQLPVWQHSYMKSQWGSCSSKGVISLNTHLVRTPRHLIEYVVLHELCHLRHHDHSRRFDALMSMHMPQWPDRSQELRQNMSLLLDER